MKHIRTNETTTSFLMNDIGLYICVYEMPTCWLMNMINEREREWIIVRRWIDARIPNVQGISKWMSVLDRLLKNMLNASWIKCGIGETDKSYYDDSFNPDDLKCCPLANWKIFFWEIHRFSSNAWQCRGKQWTVNIAIQEYDPHSSSYVKYCEWKWNHLVSMLP